MAVNGYMTIICNVAVSACGRGREWSRALDVLAVMARSSIQICAITYKAVVSSCEVGGEWAHALVILGNMARSSIAMDTIIHGSVDACICQCACALWLYSCGMVWLYMAI